MSNVETISNACEVPVVWDECSVRTASMADDGDTTSLV